MGGGTVLEMRDSTSKKKKKIIKITAWRLFTGIKIKLECNFRIAIKRLRLQSYDLGCLTVKFFNI